MVQIRFKVAYIFLKSFFLLYILMWCVQNHRLFTKYYDTMTIILLLQKNVCKNFFVINSFVYKKCNAIPMCV